MSEPTLLLSKLDALKEGFLTGRSSAHVKVLPSRHILLYEGSRPNGAYSSYIFTAKKFSDYVMHTEAHRIAKIFLNSVGIFGKAISFTEHVDATDGKTIYLSTAILEHTPYQVDRRIDTFIGHTLHEGSHILYTDMPLFQLCHSKLHSDLFNLIEDERIETNLISHYPGYVYFIEALKVYNFSRSKLDWKAASDCQKVFSLLFRLIRFPDTLQECHVEEFFEPLMKAKEILTPYPTTCQDVFDTSLAISKLFEPFMDKDEKDEDSPSLSVFGLVSGASGMGDQTVDASNFSKEQPAKIMTITAGAQEDVKHKTLVVPQRKRDIQQYGKLKMAVQAHVSTLRSFLINDLFRSKRNRSGLMSGDIDTSLIASSRAGNRLLYQESIKLPSVSFPIVLVMDESGSMGFEKMEYAKLCAVLFREAIAGHDDLSCFIYGHTADYLYSELGESVDSQSGLTWLGAYMEPGYDSYQSISAIESKANNRDGYALRAVRKRVRKFTSDKGLMIVLSDGNPSADGYYKGIQDTRESVLECQKDGFEVIQIAIGNDTDSAKMFDHFVVFNDLPGMVRSIGPVIREALRKALNS